MVMRPPRRAPQRQVVRGARVRARSGGMRPAQRSIPARLPRRQPVADRPLSATRPYSRPTLASCLHCLGPERLGRAGGVRSVSAQGVHERSSPQTLTRPRPRCARQRAAVQRRGAHHLPSGAREWTCCACSELGICLVPRHRGRDAACPLSTTGGMRHVRLVRGGGGGGVIANETLLLATFALIGREVPRMLCIACRGHRRRRKQGRVVSTLQELAQLAASAKCARAPT